MTAEGKLYDWDGPAYYPEPTTIELLSAGNVFNLYGMYFGPLRSGVWTVEPMAKAVAWQTRRKQGFPYIHRIECETSLDDHCWVIDGFGEPIHCPDFTSAIETFEFHCAGKTRVPWVPKHRCRNRWIGIQCAIEHGHPGEHIYSRSNP